jgi:membrane associated rhomboid family serine protease
MTAASVGFQCPECVGEGRRTTRAPRTVYGGRVSPRAAHATQILIALNVGVFLLTTLSSGSLFAVSGPMYTRFALEPVAVADGEYWRLITSTFLHYGPLHIAFNMWALWVVGGPLEAALGRLRYVVLYLLAGIGGGALSVLLGPLNLQAAGASGAIFGLFGAFFVIAKRSGRDTGGIVGLIGINLVITFLVPNIDWRGHIGGLVTGGLVAAALAYAPAGPQRQRAQTVGVVIVALLVVGVVVLGVDRVHSTIAGLVTPQ